MFVSWKRGIHTDRHTDKKAIRQADIIISKQVDRQTSGRAYVHNTYIETGRHRQTGKQADSLAGMQTGRQSNRQSYWHTCRLENVLIF
jgi:ribosomal protein L19E